MKVQLYCTYYNEKKEKVGEPGDIVDLPNAEAEPLLKGHSAIEVEPSKKSKRD